jgi:hypothetical protein
VTAANRTGYAPAHVGRTHLVVALLPTAVRQLEALSHAVTSVVTTCHMPATCSRCRISL